LTADVLRICRGKKMSDTLFDLTSYTRQSKSFTDYDFDIQGEEPLPLKPKDSGLAISFGKTLPQLYGGKSVTRRTWTKEYARKFIYAYWNTRQIKALDKDYRYGGKQIGWLMLIEKPYQESLLEMPEADLLAEGFPELSKPEFIEQFFDNKPDLLVWVIRFKFAPFSQCPDNGSTYAAELGQDSPTQALNCGEEAQTSSVNGMITAEISSSNDSQIVSDSATSNNLNGTNQNWKKELTLLHQVPLAHPSALKEDDSEPTTSETVSQQSLAQLSDLNPISPSSKTFPDYLLAPTEKGTEPELTSTTFSVTYPSAGTMQNGNVSAAPSLERPGIEKDYLLLRSPGGLSSTGNGRPPGQSKLESQLKKLRLIAPAEVANPEFLEAGYQLPTGWTSPKETRTAMELAQSSLALPVEMELTAPVAPHLETPSTGESQRSTERSRRSPLDSIELSTWLTLSQIRRDGGTQPRAKLDLNHVATLVEVLEDDGELDPVTVFYDGESYWLADGFHRCKAHEDFGQEEINCVITQGTRRDAVLFSVGANAEHKAVKPRSREDKRRAVTMLLNDPEWSMWSDREIARQCKVSQPFVSALKKTLTDNVISESQVTYTTKHGTTTKMRTGNIGRGETKEESESVVDTPPPSSPPPSTVTEANDYLIGFISNIEEMSVGQLEEAQRRIDQRLNRRSADAVRLSGSAELTVEASPSKPHGSQSEVDQLKAQFEAIANERDQLKTEVEAIANERDQLKTEVEALLQEIQSLKSRTTRRRKT